MVRGTYDLQALRMQSGLRLCANFRAKLKESEEEEVDEETGELSEKAIRIVDRLKTSYGRLTDGIARNRTLPTESGFTGDEVIGEYAELVLVDQYVQLERQESKQFRQLTGTLEKIPIYTEYLADVRGVGPAMAAVLITGFDPAKARHISSFWRLAGLDVGPDGRGRSRRAEHLVKREYTDKNGNVAIRDSVTYDPWLKTKLVGVLGSSFLRSNSPWREAFDNYKHRINTDPQRLKCSIVEWKKRHKDGDPDIDRLWPPGRIKNAAIRFMVKQFLADLWLHWRELEGLPVTDPYVVGMLGRRPHHAA